MRKVYFVLTVLLLISTVVQFYFAALGVFGPEDADLFVFHSVNGTVVLPILLVLAIIFAALARAGARTIWLNALPILLIALQIVLFIIADAATGTSPENPNVPGAIILGLHAVNGLAILGVMITLVGRARRRAFGPNESAAPAVA
jgi:FtsH-binding integral membrane protein